MRKYLLILCLLALCVSVSAQSPKYQRHYYVSNIEDSACQYMNIYVPDAAAPDAPILLRTFSKDFYSSSPKSLPSSDITSMALSRGYVVCVVGVRGSNSFDVRNVYQQKKRKSVLKGQEIVYTGKMPTPILDLKAAVRYLKANDESLPGSSQRIVAVGEGTNSLLMAMLGVSGMSSDYDPYLDMMGACRAPDDVWATACVSPYFVHRNELDIRNIQQTYHTDPLLRAALLKSARIHTAQGKAIPDSLGAYYFADTYITDDELDYMVDFDVRSFTQNIARNQRRSFPMIDTAAFFRGGVSDTIDIALRRRMCDPFPYVSIPNLAKSRHWLICHPATESPEMFPLAYRLVQLLDMQQIDVDFRIPFDEAPSRQVIYSGILDWIDKL